MRSLLRTDEEAHNPNLYMVDQEETAGSWASMIGGERRPGAPGRGNARVVPEHEEDGDGGSSGDEETGGEQRATGDGESVSLGGSAKFHEQLWRYREHLKKEVLCMRGYIFARVLSVSISFPKPVLCHYDGLVLWPFLLPKSHFISLWS